MRFAPYTPYALCRSLDPNGDQIAVCHRRSESGTIAHANKHGKRNKTTKRYDAVSQDRRTKPESEHLRQQIEHRARGDARRLIRVLSVDRDCLSPAKISHARKTQQTNSPSTITTKSTKFSHARKMQACRCSENQRNVIANIRARTQIWHVCHPLLTVLLNIAYGYAGKEILSGNKKYLLGRCPNRQTTPRSQTKVVSLARRAATPKP